MSIRPANRSRYEPGISAPWSSRSARGSAPTPSPATTSWTATTPRRWPGPGAGRCSSPGRTGSRTERTSSPARSTSSRSTSPRRETRSTASCAGSAWSTGEREADRVVLEHTLHPQPGYPFSLALSIEYSLSEEGLRVTTTATNVGRRGLPVRERHAPVPDPRDGDGGHAAPARARPNRAAHRRPRDPRGRRARRGHRVRLPAARGRSERRSSTTPSPISSATTTGSPASSFGIRSAERRSASGSTRATRTCSSSPEIRSRTSTGEASPSSR